jgi:hypothetical protein
MGKNLKYGEFTFAAPKARPTSAGYKSTKGISSSTYDKGHAQALKSGGKACSGYAKGGMKREPEAMVKREVALLKKAGAPKALVEHEVREVKGGKDTPATKKAEVAIMKKAKAPLSMLKHEMAEPTGMKKGGMSKMDKKMGKVMSEFGRGELHSGSKEGPVVKNPKQAVAIAYSEGRKAKKMNEGGQYASGAVEKMRKEGDVLDKMAKKYGTETQKYQKGGSVEKKLEKHANMPASKAHGPGAAARLKKGGVPVHSRVPKISRMK